MRVCISMGVFLAVLLVGVKTEWIHVSKAEVTSTEERAYAAVMLGQTVEDATSGELIDAAVARGEISQDEGLLYGVYLACGDARLPVQFRGIDAMRPAKNILWEPDVEWNELAPHVQRALRTLFVANISSPQPACADDIAMLEDKSSLWWAPALHAPPAGFEQLAARLRPA